MGSGAAQPRCRVVLNSSSILWVLLRLGALAVGAVMLLATRTDAIQVADSGELTTVACTLGVAHPPGYPLYTLLGHLFCELPWLSPAGRLSLLSVLAGLWTMWTVMALVTRVTGARWSAVLTGIAAMSLPLLWRLSSQPEVFALHIALSLVVVDVAVRVGGTTNDWTPGRESLALLGLGLLWGLALCQHLSAVGLGPLLLLVAIAVRPAGFWSLGRRVVSLVAGTLLGLTPYLYLRWANVSALPRWGETQSWIGWWHHLLRRDYGTLQLAIGEEASARGTLALFFHACWQQLGWLWLALALAGLLLLVAVVAGRARSLGLGEANRSHRALALGLLLTVLLTGPAFLSLFNIDVGGVGRQVVERFFVLPLVLLVLVGGLALGMLERVIAAQPGWWRKVVFVVSMLLVVGARLPAAYSEADVSQSFTVEDYAINMLRAAEPGAWVLGVGDVRLFGAWYVQQVLGVARDRHYVDVRMLLYRWYVDQQRGVDPRFDYRYRRGHVDTIGLIRHALERGIPVYLAVAYNKRVTEAFASYPVGPLRRLLAPGQAPPPFEEVLARQVQVDQHSLRRGRTPNPQRDPWSASLRETYGSSWDALAGVLYARGERSRAVEAVRAGRRWAPWLALPSWIDGSTTNGGVDRSATGRAP